MNKTNNINDNIIMYKEPKKEIKKEDPFRKRPNDDYTSRSPDSKFHKVRILKKNPSNELFAHSKLLDLGDYDYFNNENKNKRPKVNIVILNKNRRNPQKKEELNQFNAVKKIIPKNNHERIELYKTSPEHSTYNFNNNYNNKLYNTKNEYERYNNDNSDNNEHYSDIVDNRENFEMDDEEVKDTDEIYNNMRIKEDSNIKREKNNDGLDEFDNNFNEHDKFYKKMKNLFDE